MRLRSNLSSVPSRIQYSSFFILLKFFDSERMVIANETKLFTLRSRSSLTSHCELSLPKETSLMCQTERLYQRYFMKKIWKLTENRFGFMVLDRSPCVHLLGTFLDPFTRFNLEGYLQTVAASGLTQNLLVQTAGASRKSGSYGVLSKYLEMVSKFKGVSTIFYSWPLWQA